MRIFLHWCPELSILKAIGRFAVVIIVIYAFVSFLIFEMVSKFEEYEDISASPAALKKTSQWPFGCYHHYLFFVLACNNFRHFIH